MKYVPLHDRVIVEAVEENKLTAGGLFIPDAATQQKGVAYGTVIGVGSGRVNLEGKLIPLTIKVGDLVCFPRKAPAILPVLRDDFSEFHVLMLREADIIAVVHDMPKPSAIVDVAGAPLSMIPNSRAMPDVAAENREALDRAERAGFIDDVEKNDWVDQDNGMTG